MRKETSAPGIQSKSSLGNSAFLLFERHPDEQTQSIMTHADFELRAAAENDRESFVRALLPAFGEHFRTTGNHVWWKALEMDRSFVATEGDAIVATASSYSLELTVPGRTVLSVPGVTAVSTLPTHRRRGLSSRLLEHQTREFRRNGDIVSVLLASEGTLYRRYGYGPASFAQTLIVDRARGGFLAGAPMTGKLRLLDRAAARTILPDVYDRYRRGIVGALSRPTHLWELGVSAPPVSHEERFVIVHIDTEGLADGYAIYSISPNGAFWATAERTLTVDELVALNEGAHAALSRYCLDHDLAAFVVFRQAALDDPLRWRLVDIRAARTTETHDWLWVRLIDPAKALERRGFAGSGRLVMEIRDAVLEENQGLLQIDVQDGRAKCSWTNRPADFAIDIADLASTYLGGVDFSTLARSGRLVGMTPASLTLADRLFATERAPLCVHWF
ncbi:GNAT family N-acetyltransferase [Mesorhizobium sp. M3A.F.Ca.ET.201.01.1.1]|uniref:GNAT family N-acetyltransferase n=1 Tax=Mesorhizobium sp. M3A.F.Ca.ET.201.01.1.1 TaxID=2563946 RepID=UPI00167A205B|nr:GNAT family N-acetyltransferase [Mesorhizobium sp. M3A.F.Ca.ET.201.01.1.1]